MRIINEPPSCTIVRPTRIVTLRKLMKSRITKPGRSPPGKLLNTPSGRTGIPHRRTGGMNTFRHDDIARLAHELWQAPGCPLGSPEEDWFHAAHELRARGEGLLK